MLSLNDNSNITVFLYTSPECLLKPCYMSTMLRLIHNNVIKLLCIDEVHQFVAFGSSFLPEFGNMRDALFRKLIINNTTQQSSENTNPTNLYRQLKTPLLMMTATMDEKTSTNLQKLISVKIYPLMIAWDSKKRWNTGTQTLLSTCPRVTCGMWRNCYFCVVNKLW